MSELKSAIKQICEEKGLTYDAVIATIESALAAAYRKDFGEKNQNIKVVFDPDTGKSKIFDVKTVVEDVPEEEIEESEAEDESVAGNQKAGKDASSEKAEKKNEAEEEGEEGDDEKKKFNPKTEIQISEAKLMKKTAKLGDEIKTKLDIPEEFGRMAAQTAKQVIIQKLREAERDMVFGEFKDKEKEVIAGVVQRREGRVFLVDLGRVVGIIPPDEQIAGERLNSGQRVKVYVKEVNMSTRGPEIILSRVSDEILRKVFYLEIPEIANGLVELKAVAREAGARSKVAVFTDSENVDPIGSCVGQRGARIQTIIQELGGEKVDIIEWDEDAAKFIANALSPARTMEIKINEGEKKAVVTVAPDQLSLAIGKGGQNVRLAAHLTGWKIDIVEKKGVEEKKPEETEKINEAIETAGDTEVEESEKSEG